MASVGPLLVPGRSKNARMSAARCFMVRPSLRTSTSAAGTPLLIAAITSCIIAFAFFLSGPVGRDDALVDAPGRLGLDVLLVREHCVQACPLPVGEQARPGVQGAAGFVKRVALEPAVTGGVLLDPTPADIQRVAGEADHVERVHDGDGVGEFLGGSGLEPGEAVHRDHLDPLRATASGGPRATA